MTRETYLSRIVAQVGKPYQWGASGPDAFDCSGLVTFSMEIEKINAQALFEKFKNSTVSRMQAAPGSLYFYGADLKHINHVMTVLTHWDNGGITLIGARGGDSTIINLDAAKNAKAFVDVCFGDYWSDRFLIAADPFNGDA
jgi:cell wall-associated NlpC family hydrolase